MATRNSDGSYDAKETSSGFGKDYHGQDAFGGNRFGGIGGVGNGKFGGKAAGDFSGSDELGEGHFTERYKDYGQTTQTESPFEVEDSNQIASSMRESIRDMSSEMENSNTGDSLDTSYQIGDSAEEKARQKAEEEFDKEVTNDFEKELLSRAKASKGKTGEEIATDIIAEMADKYGIEFDRAKFAEDHLKAGGVSAGADFLKQSFNDVRSKAKEKFVDDKLKSSFTDKVEPKSETKAKAATTPSEVMEANKGPGENMKNAKSSTSDYLTSANKDAPKTARDTHDNFLKHGEETLAGALDRAAKTTTDLGIKDLKSWAEEHGADPSKLSTMRAYNVYQTKEIIKAVPGVMKEVGGYIEERIKDVLDPSKLGTRVANTLARYNAATLIGAAILSLKHGSNFTQALDMALSSVDPNDVPEVREALENALNDDSLVDDISVLIDDAYSKMNSSKEGDIDSEIVNIGRKNNTDYSGFNAGLGTSSDKDVKVMISRNIKSDPVLRVLAKKLGK